MAKIFIFSGSGHNQSFELVGNSIYIGRSEENDIQLQDMSVSRQHLKIIEKDDRLYIKDLESRNGTYVKGNKVSSEAYYEIKDHDPIVIGMTLICIGQKSLKYVTPFMSSLDCSPEESDEKNGTTFFRPLTEIKNSELINNVSSVFHVSSDINEVAEKLLDHILNHFLRVDRVVIILFFEGAHGEVTETVVSRSRVDDNKHDNDFSRLIVDRVITSKKPLVIPSVKNEKENEFSGTLRLLNIGSVMCAPIIRDSKLIGVLYIDSYEKPYGFREDDLALVTELSDLTAKSIDQFLVNSDGH